MSNVPWVRMDAGFDFHPDVRRAGHNGSSVFQTLVRLSKLLGLDGHLKDKTLDPDYLSDVMRWDTENVEKGIGACIRVGLLIADGQGGATIPGWDKYQNPDALRKQLSRSGSPDAGGQARTRADCPATRRDGTGQDVTGLDVTPPTGGEAPLALPLLAATPQTSATAKPWSKTITREQADLVFELWRKKFKKGDRWKFTSECQSKLRARANEGLKYIEARLAVHGCSSLARTVVYKDGTLRGDDENSIAFTLIFRSQSKTRGFIAEAEKAIHFVGQHLSEDMTQILKKDGTVVMEV